MELSELQATLRAKPGATEEYPFGPETLVLKVGGKMFALLGLNDTPLRLTLKCEPSYAEVLRAEYPAVTPGYYMNKQHWNTITLDGSLPEALLLSLIDDSYRLVVQGLSRRAQQQLGASAAADEPA
jgi:predicted DNA-binding protein (MmcQ/YjbR family)